MQNLILTPSIIDQYKASLSDNDVILNTDQQLPHYDNLLKVGMFLNIAKDICINNKDSLNECAIYFSKVGLIIDTVLNMLPYSAVEFYDEIHNAIEETRKESLQDMGGL